MTSRSVAALISLMVAAGCSSLPATEPPATEPPATQPSATQPSATTGTPATSATTEPGTPSTVWAPPPDDPTRPSPIAVAVDREQWAVPDGVEDCGVSVRTSGWPTTTVARPEFFDCIIAAAASGTPAQLVSTARDFEGGMAGTIYRVLGAGEIITIDYTVAPDGAVLSTTDACAGLLRREGSTDLVCT